MAISRLSKRCRSCVRLTSAEKPACLQLADRRIDRAGQPGGKPRGLVGGDQQVAAEARRRPAASARPWPRPACGRAACRRRCRSSSQRRPARRSSCTSRTVVSPATIAGRRTLALPGTCGTGMSAAIAISVAQPLRARKRRDRAPVLPFAALVADAVDVDLLAIRRQQEFRLLAGIERRLAGDDIGIVGRADLEPVFGNADALVGELELALDPRRLALSSPSASCAPARFRRRPRTCR